MNNEQIKKKLLELAESPDFSVVLSGKKSRKVDGLYKPDTKEIIIHSLNMKNDDDTMYTAIHEYAHHIQCSTSGIPSSGRYHTRAFWAILHNLLQTAEQKGIYSNVFKSDDEFLNLTKKIKEDYIKKNGKLMKELGALLVKVKKLCDERHLSFDDYADRELGIHRSVASALIKVYSYDISPDIGFDNMKTVASLRTTDKRQDAETRFINSESPDTVKEYIIENKDIEENLKNPVEKLLSEKNRLIKTISTLQKRLDDIEQKLEIFSENKKSDISKQKK